MSSPAATIRRSSTRARNATFKAAALQTATPTAKLTPKKHTPNNFTPTKRSGSRMVERTPFKTARSGRQATPASTPKPTTDRPDLDLTRLANDLFGADSDSDSDSDSDGFEKKKVESEAEISVEESEDEEDEELNKCVKAAEDEAEDEELNKCVKAVEDEAEADESLGSDVENRELAKDGFVEFLSNLSSDDEEGNEEDSDDSSGEDEVSVEDDEVAPVEAQQGSAMVTLTVDAYTSKATGLQNSTVVIDPRRSEANQKFTIDARKFIGVSKWNKNTMTYDVIHQLEVNHLLVGIAMRDNSTKLSFDAYGIPQKRLVVDFNNDIAALIAELNKHLSQFSFQFQSNNDAPLLTFNFIRGSDNANYLHGHTFYLDDFIIDELGSAATYNGRRMYRLHPGIKLKHGARKLHQYLCNKGIKATEIKVKNQTFHPIF
jgi:hypothetical protein